MTKVTLRSGEIRESGYGQHPDYRVYLEPSPKRVRVVFNDAVVADSVQVQLLYETQHLPVYYFPRDAVRWKYFAATDHSTFCPFKGEAEYWRITVGDRASDNVLWGYPDPLPEVVGLENYVAFYWGKMNRWLEEDEEVFVHPRDPHVRLDTVASHRRVAITVAGERIADSEDAIFLFETGLPTRYYLPQDDVRMDLLTKSATLTQCPYKGSAQHFTATVGDQKIQDVAWIYGDPAAEVGRIKERVCFYDERVGALALNGEPVARPRTKWSV